MNNLRKIMEVLTALGGSGTTEEIVAKMCEDYHIINDGYFKYVVSTVLNVKKDELGIKFDDGKWRNDFTDELDIDEEDDENENDEGDYDEEDHFNKGSDEISNLYKSLKTLILQRYNKIEVQPKKVYIAFKKNGKNVVDFKFTRDYLLMFINMRIGTLVDPNNITNDVHERGHNGNGDYSVTIRDNSHFNAIIELIDQAYNAIEND